MHSLRKRTALYLCLATACATRQTETPVDVSASKQVMVAPPADEALTQTRALMWKLAREARLLALLSQEPERQPHDGNAHVRAMQSIVAQLADLPNREAHPLLNDQNIAGLAADLGRAQSELGQSPPKWRTARTITDTCARCHELRACPFDSYQQCLDVPIY